MFWNLNYFQQEHVSDSRSFKTTNMMKVLEDKQYLF